MATATQTRAPKETAAEAYARNYRDIRSLLDWMDLELLTHAERAKAEPQDWGLAGDLGKIRQDLVETLAFLSGFEEADVTETLAELR